MFNKAGKFSGRFTAVYKPTIDSPSASEIAASRTPTITSSAFSKYGNITHASTDWQVSDNIDFATIRWESLSNSSNKTSITPADLESGDRYVRVRHRSSDGKVSEWSDGVLFTSPWASGNDATLTSPTNMDVGASTTVTIQPGTYRVTLWGGGGGAAAGGSRGPSSGGGAGMVYKDVTYATATNVAITIGDGGGGGTENSSNQFGAGGPPGGGDGSSGPGAFFAGGGGGGRSIISPLNITAAGGGGGGGDALAIGPGGAGGSSPGGAGGQIQSNSGSGSNPSPGFTIPGTNYSAGGNNITGSFSGSGSFSNMQGKSIDVYLRSTGPAGTIEDSTTCTPTSSSWNLSLSHDAGYGDYSLVYEWNGPGTSGINNSWNVSYTGYGVYSPRGVAGTGGGGGGGGGAPTNSDGGSGGQGGSNSGSFSGQASGSGTNAGSRYFSPAFSRYFGDGGTGNTAGQRGGARIEKIETQYQPSVSITSNLSTTNTATAGGSQDFSISATDTANNNSTVSYQWYLSTNGGSSYSPISGATSSTLSRYSPFYYDDSGHKIYCRATVTNSIGSDSVDSNVCTLTVNRNYDCNSSTVSGTVTLSGAGLKPSASNSGQIQDWGTWSPGFSDICEIDGYADGFDAGGRCNFCNISSVHQGWNLKLELRITRSTDGTRRHWGNQTNDNTACDSAGKRTYNLDANGGGWDPENDGTPTYRLVVIGDGTECKNGAGEDIGPQQFDDCILNYSYKRRSYYYETRPT